MYSVHWNNRLSVSKANKKITFPEKVRQNMFKSLGGNVGEWKNSEFLYGGPEEGGGPMPAQVGGSQGRSHATVTEWEKEKILHAEYS